MSVNRYIADRLNLLFSPKNLNEQRVNIFSPWMLACAVGTANGTLRGHDEMGELSFDQWIDLVGESQQEGILRAYAEQNAAKSYYQVLTEERAKRGRRPFVAGAPGRAGRSLIFLDFDGVLVPKHLGNKQQADPKCVAAFNSLLALSKAHIVISSDRRLDYSLSALNYCLRDWGIDSTLVLGATPRLPRNDIRGLEIQAWLDERDERFSDVERFVILDDHDDMAHLLPFLVQSKLDVGLTDELGQEAMDLLQGTAIPVHNK